MKKIFTLFIMAVVALSLYALPQEFMTRTKGQVKPSTEINKERTAKLEKAVASVSQSKIERHALPQAQPKEQAKKLAPATKKHVAAKKAAQEDVVVLNFDGFAVGPEYYESTLDWYIGVQCLDESKPEYGYSVRFDYYAPADNYCGTFTTEDFDLDYSYMYSPTSYGAITYEEITMTISDEKVNDNVSVVKLEATILGSDGITYQVNAAQELISPKATVEASILDATLEQNEEGFVLAAANEDIDLSLVVLNPEGGIVGNYAYASLFNLDNSHFTYKGAEVKPMQLELRVNIAPNAEGVLVYAADMVMLGSDTVLYVLALEAAMPAPVDTVDIACNNLTIDDSWAAWFGSVSLEAENNDYYVYGAWAADVAEEGTYDVSLFITDKATDMEYESLMATITIAAAEDGTWVATGSALCTDNVLYNLDLSWYIPEPTDTVAISYDYSSKAYYYYSSNDLQMYNQDDKYVAAIDVIGLDFGSTFTEEDVDLYYCGVGLINGENVVYESIATVQNGWYDQKGDTTILQAEFITFSGVLYQVALWYVAPTPTATQTVTCKHYATYYNEVADWGSYTMMAYSEDSLIIAGASIYVETEEEMAGTFVNEGKFNGGKYEFDGMNTFVAFWNEELGEYTIVYAQKGELTTTYANDSVYIVGTIVCDDAVEYNVTMAAATKVYLPYDTEEGYVERTYTAKDQMVIEDNTVDYGNIYFEVKAADASDILAMYFFAWEADPDIIIPEGTYYIDDSYDYNTVLASTGVDAEGYVMPSLYSTMNEEGYLVDLYFFVGGTVEVSKNEDNTLHMEINAVNSYDVPVHIVYDAAAGTTAIEDIQSEGVVDVQKKIVDGQLIIIRNGKAYNAAGVQVK